VITQRLFAAQTQAKAPITGYFEPKSVAELH